MRLVDPEKAQASPRPTVTLWRTARSLRSATSTVVSSVHRQQRDTRTRRALAWLFAGQYLTPIDRLNSLRTAAEDVVSGVPMSLDDVMVMVAL